VRMTRWSSSLWDLQAYSDPTYTTPVDANKAEEWKGERRRKR
jgi:hypothetical protein